MVAYKDYGDVDRIDLLSFTSDTNDVTDFLGRCSASGGTDTPEDVLGALDAVADMHGWQSKVRFCVFIGDAPGHGQSINDCGDDRCANSFAHGQLEMRFWDLGIRRVIRMD